MAEPTQEEVHQVQQFIDQRRSAGELLDWSFKDGVFTFDIFEDVEVEPYPEELVGHAVRTQKVPRPTTTEDVPMWEVRDGELHRNWISAF